MAREIQGERVTITREGRMTLAVQLLFDTRREALTQYPRTLEGLLFAGAEGAPRTTKEGKWILGARYDGIIDEPTERDDSYRLTGEDREMPIENFPDRELLKKEFGAYEENGRLKFPEKLPKSNVIGSLLNLDSYKDGAGEMDNPLFNATTYPEEYQVAVWRFVRRRVPQVVEGWVGTVLTKLPKGFEGMGAKSDARWYVRPLDVNKMGNCVECQVQFKEISKFQALEALQKLLKRREKGRGEGGGLITGSL